MTCGGALPGGGDVPAAARHIVVDAVGAQDGGALFRFPEGTGTYDEKEQTLDASFTGAVRFTGEHGLDLRLSAIKAAVADGRGTLYADVTGPELEEKKVPLVTFEAKDFKPKDGLAALTEAPAKLTAEGAKAFAGMYKAGTEMDRVSLAVALTDSAQLPALPDLGSTESATPTATPKADAAKESGPKSGDSGSLTADVNSLGEKSGDVVLADLQPGSADLVAEDDVITLQDVTAKLTAAGSDAFGGFYKAGAELDPLDLAVALSADAELPPTDDPSASATPTDASGTAGGTGVGTTGSTTGGTTGGVTGGLAATGSSVPAGALGAVAAVTVAAGAGVVFAVRRRRAGEKG